MYGPAKALSDGEIKIDSDSVFEKLVVKRRGGYCFEINSLLARVLRGLGYGDQVYTAAGRVVQERKSQSEVHTSTTPCQQLVLVQSNLVECYPSPQKSSSRQLNVLIDLQWQLEAILQLCAGNRSGRGRIHHNVISTLPISFHHPSEDNSPRELAISVQVELGGIDHQVVIVNCDSRKWVCDAGFGGQTCR